MAKTMKRTPFDVVGGLTGNPRFDVLFQWIAGSFPEADFAREGKPQRFFYHQLPELGVATASPAAKRFLEAVPGR